MLELRLTQVTRRDVDEHLGRFVGNAVHHITPRPEDALTWVRSIAERALTLIWDAELPDRMIPKEWLAVWSDAKVYSDDNGRKLPGSSNAQCHILRLLWRSDLTPQSTYVSRTTCLLVDHLQSVGDFGSASRSDFPEAKVSIGFAAAVVLTAISLVECLTGELEGADTV